MYELLRKYESIRLISIHPEYSQVTTMIMMVLVYLKNSLEKSNQTQSKNNQLVGRNLLR